MRKIDTTVKDLVGMIARKTEKVPGAVFCSCLVLTAAVRHGAIEVK